MITPRALPGHPFGKVSATGFAPRECAGATGTPRSTSSYGVSGGHPGRNVQVRAHKGTVAEMGAPGSYLPGAAPRYETYSHR